MLRRTFIVACAFVTVVCEREKRLFSFDFQDRDINIDLDFSVPFLSIPIKSAADPLFASGLPTINVNPASLALGGSVVMGTLVLLPLLMKNYAVQPGYDRYSRLVDSTEFSAESVMSFANQMFANSGALRGCALRIACWSEQERYIKPKIIMHFVNNKLISTIVNATALEDAMLSGRYGRDCQSFSPCPIQKQQMPELMEKLAIFSKHNWLRIP